MQKKIIKRKVERYWWFIDAGFKNTGLVVYRPQHDSIELADTLVLEHSMQRGALMYSSFLMAHELMTLLQGFHETFPAEFIVAEMPHAGAKSASALRTMSMGSAVLSAFVASIHCEFELVKPTDVKKVVRANASKDAMIDAMRTCYPGILPQPKKYAEHAADALAVLTLVKNNLDKYPLVARFAKKYNLWNDDNE